LALFSEGAGGSAKMLLKALGKIVDIRDAAMLGHGLHLHSGGFQQVFAVFHTPAGDKFRKCVAGLFLKKRRELSRAHRQLFCHGVQSQFPGQIVFNK